MVIGRIKKQILFLALISIGVWLILGPCLSAETRSSLIVAEPFHEEESFAAQPEFDIEGPAIGRTDIEGITKEPVSPPTSSLMVEIEVEVVWGGWVSQDVPTSGVTVTCRDQLGSFMAEKNTDEKGLCTFSIENAGAFFTFSVESYGVKGKVRVSNSSPDQGTKAKIYLQGYGEVILRLLEVPAEIQGIRVEIQLAGETKGREGQGGSGGWLTTLGNNVWSKSFPVPAVVPFRLNFYSRMGLWLDCTESLSVMPNGILQVAKPLHNLSMVKFNFRTVGLETDDWLKVDLTIVQQDEHPIPFSTKYLQLPGTFSLLGTLDKGQQILATCDGFAPTMGNYLVEIGQGRVVEIEFSFAPTAILRIVGTKNRDIEELAYTAWGTVGPLDVKSFNLNVRHEDGIVEARNFGHLTEGIYIGDIYLPIDVYDGEQLTFLQWPPQEAKILEEEKFIIRGLPTEMLRAKISVSINGRTVDSMIGADNSQSGSTLFAALLRVPQQEVSVTIRFLSRAKGAEWFSFDPITIIPDSIVHAQGLTLQRKKNE